MEPPIVKTSQSSPIRVDFVSGRPLGLTFAPGKSGGSVVGNWVWERDLKADVARLAEHYQVDCVVTLIEDHEFELLGIEGLRDAIRAAGMTSHAFPIVDGGIPEESGPFMALVRTMRSALRTGERVVVHCRGGLGRAGTVAACVLIALGEGAGEAIQQVRAARPGAIENQRQEQFVHDFHTFWNSASHT